MDRDRTPSANAHDKEGALQQRSDDVRDEVAGKSPAEKDKKEYVETERSGAAEDTGHGNVAEPVDTARVAQDYPGQRLAQVHKKDEDRELLNIGQEAKRAVRDKECTNGAERDEEVPHADPQDLRSIVTASDGESEHRVNDVLGKHRDEDSDCVVDQVINAVLRRCKDTRIEGNEEEAEELRPEVGDSKEADVLGERPVARHTHSLRNIKLYQTNSIE